MARYHFGGRSEDRVVDNAGNAKVGVTVWFWDAETGGNRHTDLLDASGNAATEVASGTGGYLPTGFQGPATDVKQMWAEAQKPNAGGAAGPRVLIETTDSVTGSGAVASVNGQTGAVVLAAGDVGAVAATAVGVAGGVADLDADGLVPLNRMPDQSVTYAWVDRAVSAGVGLTGGGDLSADRTIAIDTTAEAERIRDVMGTALVAGSNVTITPNDAGDTITIAASGGGGSGTGVPTVINVKDAAYGAKGDGITDDYAAILAAVTAAKAAGGPCVIYFPTGVYLCSGQINLNGSTQITLRGAAGRADRAAATNGAGTPRTELRYTGTGLRFISAEWSYGFTIDNLAVRYSSSSFTGDLIAVTGLKRQPAYGFTLRDSLLGAYNGIHTARCCLLLDGVVEALIQNSAICNATYGIIGRNDAATSGATVWAAATAYSLGALVAPTTGNDLGYYFKATVAGTSGGTEPTWPTVVGQTVTDGTVTWTCMGARPNTFATAVTILGGRFGYLVTAAILSPDEQWELYGVVFEPTTGGNPCGLKSGTIGFKGLVLSACAFWDSSNAGSWVDVTGQGLTMVGCLVSASGASSTVLGPTTGWIQGCAIHGGYYTGSGKLIDPGSQHIDQLSIRGAYLSTSMASSVTALSGNTSVTASTTYG